ncbi:DUF4369 domain-containing protein [Flavobacterium oreochromis]|uniref:DUF4369 domain-containing protein n=1 Tax=Flavobacterium oreochromis TaxID=2906078 RepID=A0ABW8P657_9FLAO|nr:DUF4369 domain-containing protein [Flavobacterium oreochromis]QYS86365.1 DUF4369 domain-containing protein [Flavobacterium oreochromis]
MKKILGISLVTLAIACNGIIGDGFKFEGEVNGLKDGTKVFLQKQDENTGMPVAIDTAKIEKGKFVFEGEAKEPQVHMVSIENQQGGFIFILEKGNITAKINKDSIPLAKIAGTYNNDELVKYNSQMMGISKRMMSFQKANIAKMQEAQKANDSVTMKKLNAEFSKFQEEFIVSGDKYINENPKSFISLLLIPTLFNTPNADIAKIKKSFDALEKDIKETAAGKKIKKQLEEFEKTMVGAKKKMK